MKKVLSFLLIICMLLNQAVVQVSALEVDIPKGTEPVTVEITETANESEATETVIETEKIVDLEARSEVRFISDLDGIEAHVYERDKNKKMQEVAAVEEGLYVLSAGNYFYTASKEGYAPILETEFFVDGSKEKEEIRITLDELPAGVNNTGNEIRSSATDFTYEILNIGHDSVHYQWLYRPDHERRI